MNLQLPTHEVRPPGRAWAVIPAAGRSRRMGQPKLLLPWPPGGSQPLIQHVLAAWRATSVERIVVTVHPTDTPLTRLCVGPRTDVVVVEPPPADMRASVLAALDHLQRTLAPTPLDAWLLAPADLPRLSAEAIEAVLRARSRYPGEIVVAVHGGRRGHPVLLPWTLAAAAAQLPAGVGIQQLLAEHAPREIEAGPAAISADVDTPSDYQ